ncbi:hypothetical protein BGZ93_005518 [Podila epicladia]|nr:hypothetical protein BGZ93_005518 [Podila epicladia]
MIKLELALNTMFQKAPGVSLASFPLKMNFPIALSVNHKGSSRPERLHRHQGHAAGIWSSFEQYHAECAAWEMVLQDVTLLYCLGWANDHAAHGDDLETGHGAAGQAEDTSAAAGLDFMAALVDMGPAQVDIGSVNIMVVQGINGVDVTQISILGGPMHLNNGLQTVCVQCANSRWGADAVAAGCTERGAGSDF